MEGEPDSGADEVEVEVEAVEVEVEVEVEEVEAADALQSVTRMNHTELNLNILVACEPPAGSLAAQAQAAMLDPRGPELPM